MGIFMMKRKLPKTPHSRRGMFYTPKSTQTRIIAGTLAGRNKSEIERETGVSRKTITRILSQTEVKAMLERYRDDYRAMVPGAIALLHREMSLKPKGKKHATSDQ